MSSSAIVEVCLRPESTAQPDAVKAHINQLLAQHGAPLREQPATAWQSAERASRAVRAWLTQNML